MPPVVAPDVMPRLSSERISSLSGKKPSRTPLLSVAAAAIVVLLAMGILRSFRSGGISEDRVKVVAAGKDIPPGSRLGFTSLHYLDMPRKYVTSNMVTATNLVVGRVAREFIPIGEPIAANMLFPGGEGLSMDLAACERAIALELSDDALLDHSIRPGDRVDILVTATAGGKKYTKTIGQDVRVLVSYGKEAIFSQKGRMRDCNRVTLATTAREAEDIAEAAELGKIRLILRNRLTRQTASLPGSEPRDVLPTAYASLIDRQAQPILLPPPVAASKANIEDNPAQEKNPFQWVVEVFSGNRKDKYGVPEK